MSGQKVFFTWITKTAGIIELIGYTAYAINQYQMGEIEAKDIILTIISPPDLEEIIENYTQLGVYAVALSLQNPYPPHSYQATTWIKTNFYYILMP